ncbi:hypothetical protein, partial [uncultured Muribaculum sp.]
TANLTLFQKFMHRHFGLTQKNKHLARNPSYPHGNEVVTKLLRVVAFAQFRMTSYQHKRKA